ncbi:MAG: hypothetical protein JSV65_18855 [Armatimonadota bacterium]|nr:MAG: hypothetical protein JSV65_18855 [Armatimonadota bacterium]
METDRKRSWRTPLILIGVILALAVLGYALLDWETARALQAELDRLRAAGEPLTMAEVAPDPVPDSDNAALLYIEAFAHVQEDRRLHDICRGLKMAPSTAARRKLIEELRPLVDANRQGLAIAARAAQLPHSRLELDWESWDVGTPTLVIQYTPRFRSLSRVLAAQAALESADGDADAAIESCLTGVRIACHLMQDPEFTLLLTSYAVQSIALAELRAVLEENQLDAPTCAAACDELGAIDLRGPLHRALQVERAGGLLLLDYLAAHRTEPIELEFWDADTPLWASVLYASPLCDIIQRSERLMWLDLTGRTIELSGRPYREVARQVSRVQEQMGSAPRYYVGLHWISVYPKLIASRDQCQTVINATRVALALEAYHSKHGKYPNSLVDLHEYPSWALPDDPFSDKPFAYRRRGEGFVLHSFGGDLDDDGGRPVEGSWLADGDLVWECAK